MQFSKLEREMHDSPLKCTTNGADGSPEKTNGSNKKLRKCDSKKLVSSPDKASAARLNLSPSPPKRTENPSKQEDRKSASPDKKFQSPTRTGKSPKKLKPFG